MKDRVLLIGLVMMVLPPLLFVLIGGTVEEIDAQKGSAATYIELPQEHEIELHRLVPGEYTDAEEMTCAVSAAGGDDATTALAMGATHMLVLHPPQRCPYICECTVVEFAMAAERFCQSRGGVCRLDRAIDGETADIRCCDGTRARAYCCC